MKPEEKYYVIGGIREEFDYYQREVGFWVCRKDNGIHYTQLSFFTNKKDADKRCAELREQYRLSAYKEGEVVWFMDRDLVCVGEIANVVDIGHEMYYEIANSDSSCRASRFFSSQQEIFEYLVENIKRYK